MNLSMHMRTKPASIVEGIAVCATSEKSLFGIVIVNPANRPPVSYVIAQIETVSQIPQHN